MNDDKNFDKRNELNAELAQLMSNLSANTSPIGDWKVIKIYEARLHVDQSPFQMFEAELVHPVVDRHLGNPICPSGLLD